LKKIEVVLRPPNRDDRHKNEKNIKKLKHIAPLRI